MKKYLEKAIHKVFENALVFELFRKVVHKDFLTEKNIIKKEISLSSGQKVLDLGCGIGQFSVLFEYNNYVGADIDHKDFLTEKNIIKKEISLSSGQKVLDLGCGIGQFSVLFEYNNYVGADIDKACIERARKLYSDKKFVLLYEKDTKLPFEDKSFDYILLA